MSTPAPDRCDILEQTIEERWTRVQAHERAVAEILDGYAERLRELEQKVVEAESAIRLLQQSRLTQLHQQALHGASGESIISRIIE